MKGPCKDCPNRHLACHDGCERYKAWLAAYHADRQDIRRLKEIPFNEQSKKEYWRGLKYGRQKDRRGG
ncbi:MAG: hypothetical protein IJQ88_05220 [Clostridia bacterium]|nr:hypothetical protein [Clostridia bacterium]MBQ9401514.1 hypothetical protein [Clostridia bacterium]